MANIARALKQDLDKLKKPTVVCLCGSTKFKQEFIKANFEETMAGKIVLTVGFFAHVESDIHILTLEEKKALDELHKRKIDLADEVLFLNVYGYLGDSSISELNYAYKHSKRVRFLEIPPQEGDSRLIQVCDKCFQASCWQGEFMCDDAHGAGTVYRTVRQLKALNLEHPSYWKTDKELADE